MKTCHKCGAQYEDTASFCLRDGEVLGDDEAQKMTGRILDGQYEIEAFIAQGGMGAVYRARHTLLGDRVAIKVLPPEMRRHSEWLKRFQREGQAARRFHHPNSVIVHDLRTSAEGEVYLVMEYVEGRTLEKELAARGGPLPLNEILGYVEPVASVLDAAHQMNVIHRDLKPSNIMITTRGVLKVLDLGIAKLSDLETADAQLTTAGQMLGTPYYMSPEQWGELQRDGRTEVDGRADVYSLGVVVYELTTGRRPFEAASVIELRHAHCRIAPRFPSEFAEHLPAGWKNAMLRALSKDRNDRQLTAGEFVRELRASLGANSTGGNAALGQAPTLLNPPVETYAALARETPSHLNAATVQGYGEAQTYTPQPPAPYAQPSVPVLPATRKGTNSRSLLILGAIVLLALAAVAAGGFAVWKWKEGRSAETAREAGERKQSASEAADDAKVADTADKKDVSADNAFMRYHLLLGNSLLDAQKRATGRDPVQPGQSIQLALTPRESGYLYMTGHDSRGNPVVMPAGILVSEIQVSAGEEALVPELATIKLDDQPGTESFTVIFTSKRLTLPFVSETLPLDGSFRKLTADEQQKIEELRREAAPVKIEYTNNDGASALVRLSGERGTRPVVFDIKLVLER